MYLPTDFQIVFLSPEYNTAPIYSTFNAQHDICLSSDCVNTLLELEQLAIKALLLRLLIKQIPHITGIKSQISSPNHSIILIPNTLTSSRLLESKVELRVPALCLLNCPPLMVPPCKANLARLGFIALRLSFCAVYNYQNK